MPARITPREAAALAKPGSRVLLAGCAGEPCPVLDAVAAEPALWRDLCLTGAFIPGVNDRDYAALGEGTRVETIFTTRGLMSGVEAGRVDHLPLHYTDYWERLARPGVVDLVYTVVPPPAEDDTIGLGLCADFIPAAIGAGARLVGIVAAAMPDVPCGPRLPLSRFEALVEAVAFGLSELPQPGTDPVSEAIADHIAGLIPEGATIQLGLGRLQTSILRKLASAGRRDLGYHSGMISPAVIEAREVFGRGITTGVALGHAGFYSHVAKCDTIRFAPVIETHSHDTLARIPRLVAVNSCLEVDLKGQVNAEVMDGRQVSGQGGLVDFLRGARRSEGGLSIIALSATAQKGRKSRIVRHLSPDAVVSVARSDVDVIVTEYGVADLREIGLGERARRLRMIAAPEFRHELS